MNDHADREAARARLERANDRVAILTGLANRKTADPERVLADLEAAVIEQREAEAEMLLSPEALAATR